MTTIVKCLRALGLAALLIASASQVVAATATKVLILTDWQPTGIHAGLHLALRKGWFKSAGLDVQIIDGKGSSTTIQQLAAGQVDIALAQLATMAAAISSGMPVISVMGIVRDGSNGVIVPVASGWGSFKDLEGKKVAISGSGGAVQFLDPFLKKIGVGRSDYTFVNVDSSAVLSSYVNGAVDAVVGDIGNLIPITSDKRPSKPIFYSDVGLRIPGYGLIVRRGDLNTKADIIRKVVAIQQRAWRYIEDGHEAEGADAILADRVQFRLDRNQMIEQIKIYESLFDTPATKDKPIGWQAASDWADATKIMEGVGLVKSGLTPVDFFTNRFVPNK